MAVTVLGRFYNTFGEWCLNDLKLLAMGCTLWTFCILPQKCWWFFLFCFSK